MDREKIWNVYPQPMASLSKSDQRRVAHEAISEALSQLENAGREPDEWERDRVGRAMALFVFWSFYLAAFNECLGAAIPPGDRGRPVSEQVELPTFEQLKRAWASVPPGDGSHSECFK